VKEILLIAVNARYSHSNLALFYMKRQLQQEGFHPALLELTIKEKTTDLLEKILLHHPSPQAYIFSVYIWNSTLIKSLVIGLKALRPHIPVILGGPEVAYNADLWKAETPADYLVKGPGESAILPILREEHPPGLVESPAVDLNTVPFPYNDEDLALLKNRLVYYESSRGCPFSCTYCLSSCEGQELQFRDMDKVKKELRILAYSGARVIKLVDRSFNVDSPRAREIWRFLLELKDPCSFHFEVHPLFLEEEDFQLLAQVPPELFHFEVGIQSTSDEELKAVKRTGRWDQIKPRIRRLIEETSIPIHLDQIVALPGADSASVEKSFNDILGLQPEEFQMGFLKLLPGTELAKGPGQFMVASAEPPYEVLQTPVLSFEEIRGFHKIEELLNAYYNSGLFRRTMALLLDDAFPYHSEPFALFQKLARFIGTQGRAKPMQWAKLAEILWDGLAGDLENEALKLRLKDALRLDWAPLSQGQYLPGFLNYRDVERIKTWRHELQPLCRKKGISSADFKRSILIWLESEEEGNLRLFVPSGKVRKELVFNAESFE